MEVENVPRERLDVDSCSVGGLALRQSTRGGHYEPCDCCVREGSSDESDLGSGSGSGSSDDADAGLAAMLARSADADANANANADAGASAVAVLGDDAFSIDGAVAARGDGLVPGESIAPMLAELAAEVLCIEGKIGVGKSSFGAALARVARALGISAHFEVEKRQQRMLAKFLEDPRAYAALFQMAMLEDALNRQHTCALAARWGAVALLDRGALGNTVFGALNAANGNISPRDYAFYRAALPHDIYDGAGTIVYLHVSNSVAVARMRTRGDPVETAYTAAYLWSLDDAYFRAILRALVAGAAVVPVPWDHQIALLGDTDTLTLSLSALPVPRIAADVAALLRFACAVVKKRVRVRCAHVPDAPSTHDESERLTGVLLAACRAAPPSAGPLQTIWASDAAAERAAAACNGWTPRSVFAMSVYERACAANDDATRELFQRALFSALAALEPVVISGDI